MGEQFEISGALPLRILTPSDKRGQSFQSPFVKRDPALTNAIAKPASMQGNES